MSEKAYPWDQQEGETEKAYLAFTCFRDLGLGRTIEGAWRAYCEESEKGRKKKKSKGISRPEKSGPHFRKWLHENNWWDRAKAWDYYINRQANMRFIQKRESILESQFEEFDKIAELCMSAIEKWVEEQKKKQVRGLSPNVAINGLLNVRKLQTDAIKELAEVQALLDAQMLEGVEEELEFFDPDDYQQ